MKEKNQKINENLNEDLNKSDAVVEEKAQNSNSTENTADSELKIDVDKLSDKEARSMLKEVLEANAEIIKELDSSKTESDKFKDNWYRTTAEYENYKKRNADLRKTSYDDGKTDAIKGIFTIGDSLDRAMSMEMDNKTKEGVALIQRQFGETMKALGVEEVNPIGKTFSPEEAEAIAMVDALEGEESGIVRNVFKKGYKLNGRTVRYAQVIVVK